MVIFDQVVPGTKLETSSPLCAFLFAFPPFPGKLDLYKAMSCYHAVHFHLCDSVMFAWMLERRRRWQKGQRGYKIC